MLFGDMFNSLRLRYKGTTAEASLELVHFNARRKKRCRRETVLPEPGSPITRKVRARDLLISNRKIPPSAV